MLRVSTLSFSKTTIRAQWVPSPHFGVKSIHNLPQIKTTQNFFPASVTFLKKPTTSILTKYVLTRFISSPRTPLPQKQMPEWMKEELERAKKREKKHTLSFDPEVQEELTRGPDDVNVLDNLILTLFFVFLLLYWISDALHKYFWTQNNAFMCFDYPHLKSPKYGILDPYVCFKHYVLDQRTNKALTFHAVKFYPHRTIPSENDKWRIAFNPTNPAEFTWLYENNATLYTTLALKGMVLLYMGRKLARQYPTIYKEYDARKYFRKVFNLGD